MTKLTYNFRNTKTNTLLMDWENETPLTEYTESMAYDLAARLTDAGFPCEVVPVYTENYHSMR